MKLALIKIPCPKGFETTHFLVAKRVNINTSEGIDVQMIPVKNFSFKLIFFLTKKRLSPITLRKIGKREEMNQGEKVSSVGTFHIVMT